MTRPFTLSLGLLCALVAGALIAAQAPPQQRVEPLWTAPPQQRVEPLWTAPPLLSPPIKKAVHPRGARPSPRSKIFRAPHHVAKAQIPATFGVLPTQLSCWGNCTYGDCVSAEECFAKACYSVQLGAPELFIPEATIVTWAGSHGFLNGADLTSVMDAMASDGITVNGVTYKDGPYQSVDYTTYDTMCSAISTGPVKVGIAADQLQTAVDTTNDANGWWCINFTVDQNEDHCIPIVGYGPASFCATVVGTPVPSGLDPKTPCYIAGTWGSFGVFTFQSLVNICGEAWLRSPTTIPPPVPTPNPTPNPMPPNPAPTPVPTVYSLPVGTYTVTSDGKKITFTPATDPPAPAPGQTITFPAPVSSISVVAPAPTHKP